ncbi:MAG: DNA topoisomerase [Candidatus Nitrosocaldus sp.]|nr:DNA topoisomerase [Candidatus Nitrosocaldus sp.]
MFIVVAEKASVAEAIRDALPYKGLKVTWVRGHVMEMDLPMNLRAWRLETIRDIMGVRRFRYRVRDRESYSRLSSVFSGRDSVLVIATDNDHEGELIGYEILMLYRRIKGKDAEYYRMRFNSTDRREIVGAWSRLEGSLNWRWVGKAMFRHKFDLLTGAAYTRLLTLSISKSGGRMAGKSTGDGSGCSSSNSSSRDGYSAGSSVSDAGTRHDLTISTSHITGTNTGSNCTGSRKRSRKRSRSNDPMLISWGSCQTPTLNFIVEREREIEQFRPVDYWYIDALLMYSGIQFRARSTNIYDEVHASSIYESCRGSSTALVLEYKERAVTIHRPLPSRTDDVLRDLVRITGRSASYLLDVMEDLYSRGYISYPRTDTNRYPRGFDFSRPLRAALDGLGITLNPVHARPRNGMHDDNAHPPIYPVSPYHGSGIEREVWEYIARRFLANAYADDATLVKQHARLVTAEGSVELHAEGLYVRDEGFLAVYRYFMPEEHRIPVLVTNSSVDVEWIDLVKDRTKPPSRLSEAELLEIMERHGIGTDATRAEFPSLLLRRGYATKVRSRFKPTALGTTLIDALNALDGRLVNADTRRMVEMVMRDIEDDRIKEDEALNRSIELYDHLLSLCIKNIGAIADALSNITIAGKQGRR